jgi:hypothetical protein
LVVILLLALFTAVALGFATRVPEKKVNELERIAGSATGYFGE